MGVEEVGRGVRWGVGEEIVNQLKTTPGSAFVRVGKGEEEASAGQTVCGRAPRPVAKGRCAPAQPGCPAGTGPPARGLPVAWCAVLTRSSDLLSLG